MKLNKIAIASSLGLMSMTTMAALPAVNLGSTSFLDGAPLPDGPGWYFTEYLTGTTSDKMYGNHGDRSTLPKQDIDTFAPVTQIIYNFDQKWGNLTPSMNVNIPWVAKVHTNDGLNGQVLNSQTGLGDLEFGFALQFDPIMGEIGPKFAQRVEFDLSTPTGSYNPNLAINPGNNTYLINPYYAATYWISPKWTVSGRLSYLWNGKNTEPATSLGAKDSSQEGQAIHVNFASAYAISQHISLGINGYWLKQITNNKVDGETVTGQKEKVWAIGPGGFYSFNKANAIFANLYFEHGAVNRSQGEKLVVRINHYF